MAEPIRHRHLLMTGATGMVGSYVMALLLRDSAPLAVIARGKGKQSPEDRIDSILARFEQNWQVKLGRPTVLSGDLSAPDLGLSQTDRQFATRSCDRLINSAASLNFAPAAEDPNNEPYRTNVDGTENLLELFRDSAIESLHHISTAYVCGTRQGNVLESESNVGQSFANDYERSKTIAESMVADAFRSRSLTVYRPSIVIDRTGLAPVSGDRTIYGAYSMYQMLAAKFGIPEDGVWFRNLGFAGDECKNLVDVDWIARAIATIVRQDEFHGKTYHLTTPNGTSIETLDQAFKTSTKKWLSNRRVSPSATSRNRTRANPTSQSKEIDQMADPFVRTFLPYFRDDPKFDRTNIDQVVAKTDLDPTPTIGQDELLAMINNWSAPGSRPTSQASKRPASSAASSNGHVAKADSLSLPANAEDKNGNDDDVVICGYSVRLPGGVDNAEDFKELLFEGRSAIASMPEDRLDRSLYFDSRKGVPGKTYTELGGCVDPTPLDQQIEDRISSLGEFDLTHRQFAQVACKAFHSAMDAGAVNEKSGLCPKRCGVFVGHSGGTETGGPLAMATLAESAASLVSRTETGSKLDAGTSQRMIDHIVTRTRQSRPTRTDDGGPHLSAYSAASLAARLTGMQGRREVIDAACSSSLLALQHAFFAIKQDSLDLAMVGGATFNNVDNLALFSQSGACSDAGSRPFDRRASGLISSEGYVAIVLARRSIAEEHRLPILATVKGVGVASDGKGKGLWAPRSEGQQLAMQRASAPETSSPAATTGPLEVDYLECHATSTQVGDATELESLTALLGRGGKNQKTLPIGSVKSNLGHLLEAAGLVGVVKCLIGMQHELLPPSINFQEPTDLYKWEGSPIKIAGKTQPWHLANGRTRRTAGVNAFGIGGLNAHAVVEQAFSRNDSSNSTSARVTESQLSTRNNHGSKPKVIRKEKIAIVGRGVILPGASSVEQLACSLAANDSQIGDAPENRWLNHPSHSNHQLGIASSGQPFSVPHCRGGYVRDFQFDAQSYRIPPKLVRNANPAQLMLIEAVRQAIDEFDSHNWTVNRQRVGVSVGTIFGGEFSNQLQVGLRLPELSRYLQEAAQANRIGEAATEAIQGEFRKTVLAQYPALLDETGGFTASTLASAIARIFDLMGGAYAVDADEASGGLALLSGIDRLRRGDVDVVICGATHRAMDLVAFEQLYRRGQLVPSGRVEDLPEDGSRIFPGEGVASIILQRLGDAVDQGRTIYGVIDQTHEDWTDSAVRSRRTINRDSKIKDAISSNRIVKTLGHLGGAHGLVRTIAKTIENQQSAGSGSSFSDTSKIIETADDGYQIGYSVSRHQPTRNIPTTSNTNSMPVREAVERDNQPEMIVPRTGKVDIQPASAASRQMVTVRLEAANKEQMLQTLRRLSSTEASACLESAGTQSRSETGIDAVKSFSSCQRSGKIQYQAGIVGRDIAEVQLIASELLNGPLTCDKSAALPRHAGWLRAAIGSADQQARSQDRIAWLFPGQGSQYSEVPRLYEECDDAREFLNSFDSTLESMSLEPIANRLDDSRRELGRNVWLTQLWVLAAGTMMTDSLLKRGHRPDVVLGHSFGECTAAWCAGVMTTHQAIEFAKQRSDAVVTTNRDPGELLSVRAAPADIASALQGHAVQYTLTHHNAPEQTVLAANPSAIASIKSILAQTGIACVTIPVPAAFHTPAMQPAQDLLHARFMRQPVRPPRFPFLSAVSNRYLSEPQEIVSNLVNQLTQPVCFAGAIKRLVEDGCGLFVEVGPSDVLTRLTTATVNGATAAGATANTGAICLSADDRSRPLDQQNGLIDLAMEAFGSTTHVPSGTTVSPADSTKQRITDTTFKPTDAVANASTGAPSSQFEVVDVTRRTRPRHSTANAPSKPAGQNGVSAKMSSNGNGSASSTNSVESPSNRFAKFGPVATVTTDPQSQEHQSAGGLTQPHSKIASGTPALEAEQSAQVNVLDSAKSFLLDLVVDLTGYDEEIIEFDADLEGELGVDSIKKAQLIGEIVQWANLEIDLQSMRLSQFDSLDDILALLGDGSSVEVAQWPETAPVTQDDSAGFGTPIEQVETNSVSDQAIGSDHANLSDSLKRMIIDLVVDQTGYDEEIIDMEADLEGELGVDSIKRAQLLGELETHYQLQSLRDQNLRLSDFPTLTSIHSYVLNHLQSNNATAAADLASVAELPTATEEKKKHFQLESADFALAASDFLFAPPETESAPSHGTHRFVMRMRNAPRRVGMPSTPALSGPALVIGRNAIADELVHRLTGMGITVDRFGFDQSVQTNSVEAIDSALDQLWKTGVSRNIFITTPYDNEASWKTTDAKSWSARQSKAFAMPYRVCQRWMQRAIDESVMDQCSLMSIVNGGGNFGFGNASQLIDTSAESGGIAGLTKAMLIEAWMRGFRDTPMLVLDTPLGASASSTVDGAFRELAVASYEEEVCVDSELRHATCARYSPLPEIDPYRPAGEAIHTRHPLTRGGVWLVAGGGRGITAMTAMELAERHDLTLHLLGMAPAEPIDPATRKLAQQDRAQLRRQTMARVQQAGGNPVKHWRNYEKAIEIDQTLLECERRGIKAAYHSVDVSDADAVDRLVSQIRTSDGPIRGVIQGAGSGQDARFDRKRPEKVKQCLSAKIDGCTALAAATKNDPLEWFIGFGSISGRFGANGHTDYSAANDMLAKMIGRLGVERPETRCFTFHWHAWGDIGMATKPEAKLALDMIGMEFMPAREGLMHFLGEIEQGGDEPEVLITDRRYVRKFFPDDMMSVGNSSTDLKAPMLDPFEQGKADQWRGTNAFKVTLEPSEDLFLKHHTVHQRPTLPFVMAIEMMAEAHRAASQNSNGFNQIISCSNVSAIRPLKCLSDDAFAVELITHSADDRWTLVSDLRRRDGRLVEAAREHFTGSFQLGERTPQTVNPNELACDVTNLNPIEYMDTDAPVYHGPGLQCLRSIGFGETHTEVNERLPVAKGIIVAPSPAHLAGEQRPLAGWAICPATMDAVLYASGMLAYHVIGEPSLPIRFDKIDIGRLPDPGEPLEVLVRWEGTESADDDQASSTGIMSAVLAGQNGDMILRLSGYRVGWLS